MKSITDIFQTIVENAQEASASAATDDKSVKPDTDETAIDEDEKPETVTSESVKTPRTLENMVMESIWIDKPKDPK
jgi:hypothetical protein